MHLIRRQQLLNEGKGYRLHVQQYVHHYQSEHRPFTLIIVLFSILLLY